MKNKFTQQANSYFLLSECFPNLIRDAKIRTISLIIQSALQSCLPMLNLKNA